MSNSAISNQSPLNEQKNAKKKKLRTSIIEGVSIFVVSILIIIGYFCFTHQVRGNVVYEYTNPKFLIFGGTYTATYIEKDDAKGHINIKRKIFNIPVTEIGERAFANCYNITSVTIPDTIKKIGFQAFDSCYRLVEINNKSDLTIEIGSTENGELGRYAKAIYTGDYVSNIFVDDSGFIIYKDNDGNSLIGYSGNDTEIVLPSNVSEINTGAFFDRSDLSEITIPSQISSIKGYAFDSPDSRDFNAKVIFSEGSSLQNIDANAFAYGNTYGNTMLIKGGIADWCQISYLLDRNGNNNSNIYIKDKSVFNDYADYTAPLSFLSGHLKIPSYVKKIGAYAFNGTGITALTIPDSVTEIGTSAFKDCKILSQAILPKKFSSSIQSIFGIDYWRATVTVENELYYRVKLR